MRRAAGDGLRSVGYNADALTPEALRPLAANVGPSQVLLGTDYLTRKE